MSQTKKEAPQQEAAIQEQTQEIQAQTQEAAQRTPGGAGDHSAVQG